MIPTIKFLKFGTICFTKSINDIHFCTGSILFLTNFNSYRCNGKISTEVFRSYSSYNDKRMASMEQSKEKTSSLNIGGTAQGKGNIKGVPVAGQMSMNYARNDKQENNKQSEESKLQ